MPRSSLLWGIVFHVTLVGVFGSVGRHSSTTEDPHGGVVMGVPNKFCDDGQSYLSIDWDPSVMDEHTCYDDRDLDILRDSHEECEVIAQRPIHVCYPEKIEYTEDLPTSGRHRPLWPQYGEYRYLPPQRWLHSLEHGAVVFLYHPCAKQTQIDEFKALARGCMRRHIISPSKRIPLPNMFAVLAWKCKMVMTHVDVPKIVNFVRTHALHSPESTVFVDGQYNLTLTRHAELVSDLAETNLCPKMSLMAETTNMVSEMSTERRKRLVELRKIMENRAFNLKMSRYLNSLKKR